MNIDPPPSDNECQVLYLDRFHDVCELGWTSMIMHVMQILDLNLRVCPVMSLGLFLINKI